MKVARTEVFSSWLARLKDREGRAQILKRIDRVEGGNLGDVKPVRAGVSEMRIHSGPGYRVYLAQHGTVVVLLLCGGDKGTQARDIERAVAMLKELKEDGSWP